MNSIDPGPPGGTGLVDRADTRSTGSWPDATAGIATIQAAKALRAFLRQKGAALGIADRGDPKSLYWRALTNPKFRWYFAGSAVSNFGTWLQNTAQVVLAYQLTHSVLPVGLVTCAQFSSPLLFGPFAGGLTHRLGNWRMLICTQYVSMIIAATLAALQFSHVLSVGGLYIGAMAIGLAFTFALPAQSVTVAGLVPEEQVKRALAMDSVSYNLGRALAPVLCVAIFVNISVAWAFAMNAMTFLFFAIVLLRLRPRQVPQAEDRPGFMDGLRITARERRIMLLLLMVAAVTVATDPILVLGPALARSAGESPAWSGVFITALGAGNVLGSLRPSRQQPSIRRAATVLCILSLSMVVFAAARWFWLGAAAALAAGMSCLLAGTITRALLLQRAGLARQASVMAVWAVAWAGSKPIASLVDGFLAGAIGVRLTGMLLALPAAIPAVVLICWPREGGSSANRWWMWVAAAKEG